MVRRVLALIVAFSCLAVVPALFAEESDMTARARNKAAVQKLFEEHTARFKNHPDMMVRPGLLADRKEKTIRVWGESIRLKPGDPVEFFLIAENSGHDYEAMAVSFARSLDIHRALEFVGVPPGRPVDYEKFQLWPKGERVSMTFEWDEPAEDPDKEPLRRRVPAEDLIIDTRTRETLSRSGFSFVGSVWVEEESGKKVYAADAYDPQAIASDYNEELTVLDVSRKAVDGEVYGFQQINPDLRLPGEQLIEIVIEPEYRDGRTRVRDLVLEVQPQRGTTGDSLRRMVFSLKDLDGAPASRGTKLKHVLAAFERSVRAGEDPFVQIDPDEALSVQGVRELHAFMSSIATDDGIRIEPPPEGHLFFKAFLPDERFRERAGRPSQPWELHLSITNDVVHAVLKHIEELWEPEQEEPRLVITDHEVKKPQDIRKVLDEKGAGVPVMLVFAPKSLSYGRLLSYVRPALPTHSTIYVFLPKE